MSNSRWLTLIAPATGVSLACAHANAVAAPALARLAGRGSLHLASDRADAQAPSRPWQRLVLRGLDLSTSLPSAPVTAMGCGLDGTAGHWMQAELVHFAAGLDRVTCIALRDEAAVTDAERAQLLATLAPYFPSDDFTLHAAGSEWFVHSTRPLDVVTASPEIAVSNELQSAMPRGADARLLRRLMTELQMLLHEHPVNDVRAARGLPAVNALWLWGAGQLPATQPSRSLPLARTTDPWLRGLYRMHGHAVEPLPADATALLAGLGAERTLALISASELESFDSMWIAPLAQALSSRRIARLDLILDEWHLDVTRAASRRFWRRPLPPAQWERRA
ncbi:MAG TPA: hypothetical protein VKB34_22070 [Povalibacter sp.]|nr:hypothetical protein [Povalibacter sp.]